MKDVYMNYELYTSKVSKINDSLDIINSSTKKMKELLGDLNEYWIASTAKTFTSNMNDYIEVFEENYKKVSETTEKENNVSNAYKKFDEYFSNKAI